MTFTILRYEKELEHKPLLRARNRMYKKALGKGENLMFWDAVDIVKNDGYAKHISGVFVMLCLAIDIYNSCGFALPDEYAAALKQLISGNGTTFRNLAIDAF